MPELNQEEKIKLFEKLPKELRELMESENTGAFLLYLGQKYNLPDEKISALSKVVGDVILRITPIINLAQEIANKVIPDQHTAMAIAQELNSELLMPALMPAPTVPVAPTAPTPTLPTLRSGSSISQPNLKDLGEIGTKTDQYRESMAGEPAPQLPGPKIIDLRKTPAVSKVESPPMAAAPAYIPPKVEPPRPLTFTKPVEPIKSPIQMPPLIEAEPHKAVPTVPEISEKPPAASPRPQYIIRPPGLAPTDLPTDVLDLRKDKGEF